jgi:hypothetical protein
MNNKVVELYKSLGFEEAVSHRIHTRIFEILGYLSIMDKSQLSKEDQEYFSRVEELSKSLISELHGIIDYYRTKKE